MILKHFTPGRPLAPYIHRIWNFESKFGIPVQDLRTIAPNGRIKLIIPYRSHLKSTLARSTRNSPESSLLLIGQTTTPAIIESDGVVGTIGVEFRPASVYRFFSFPLHELTNQVYDVRDLPGAAELQNRISDAFRVEEKIAILEAFLLRQLDVVARISPIVEFAVGRIVAAHGLIRIGDLARDLGYSRRHVDRLFAENVGVHPKEFASIVRFQSVYQAFNAQGTRAGLSNPLDLYYDQSHYIKEFRKFTGLPPREYLKKGNDFGKVFLKS